jgi:hypothetical protein
MFHLENVIILKITIAIKCKYKGFQPIFLESFIGFRCFFGRALRLERLWEE